MNKIFAFEVVAGQSIVHPTTGLQVQVVGAIEDGDGQMEILTDSGPLAVLPVYEGVEVVA